MYSRPARQQPHPAHGFQNGHPNGYPNGYHTGYQTGESPMSAHSYQHSYETMTSGSEDYGKSTNPSSQNSSFDQLHQLRKPEEYPQESPYANDIRFNQVYQDKPFSSYGGTDGNYSHEVSSPHQISPNDYVPPPVNNPRQPIQLNGSPNDPSDSNTGSPPKRQSWIKRRFSRREN